MIDCSNAEIRDLLPEYARGTLRGEMLPRVEEHVLDCGPCTEESELLRRLDRALSATPAVDVSAIVAALPPSPGLRPRLVRSESAPKLRAWHSRPWLRVAAGLVIAVGMGSMYISRPVDVLQPASVAVAQTSPASASAVVVADGSRESRAPVAGVNVRAELSVGRADELSDAELRGLLEEIDAMKGVPAAESEDVVLGLGSAIGEGL